MIIMMVVMKIVNGGGADDDNDDDDSGRGYGAPRDHHTHSGPCFRARRLNNYSRLTFEQLNILHQSFQFICAELQPRKTSKIFSVSLISICRLQLSMDVGIGSNNLSHHIFTCFFFLDPGAVTSIPDHCGIKK